MVSALGEDTLEANGRQMQCLGHACHRLVQLCGKGMGGIHDESYAVMGAERPHGLAIHSTVYAHAVVQRHVLFARLRAIEEWLARLLQFLDGLSSFRCPAEYQYHNI